VINLILDLIRQLADQCTGMQAFHIFRSFGGVTGAGFRSLLLEPLSVDSSKNTKLEFRIDSVSQVHVRGVVDPYNSILVRHAILEHSDCPLMVDTEAPSDLCGGAVDIKGPTSKNLNGLIRRFVWWLIASLRFNSVLKLISPSSRRSTPNADHEHCQLPRYQNALRAGQYGR
jgi:tubulin alpha